ncbi:MAG: vWA domain-containing protein [Microcystaceae cyanobacterium]
MKVNLKAVLSDAHLDAKQTSSQRQLCLSLSALREGLEHSLPLNLCLVLDRSGSMGGSPLSKVKEAALGLVAALQPTDRLSVIAFNHKAEVIIPNQLVEDAVQIAQIIQGLKTSGGTAIDEGMKLGIKEAASAKEERVSQIFLLTDGENEHGDNDRCLNLAKVAAEYNITINTLGFGSHWNQDILEAIADSATGSLSYIEQPEQALEIFTQLLSRMQTVGLTNVTLQLELAPQVRLAELKPIAQVEPETIELTVESDASTHTVRLGDLMTEQARVILGNLYIGQLPAGEQTIGSVQIRYDDPAQSGLGLLSEKIPLTLNVQATYQSQPNDQAQKAILTLAKYRQTQIAETKLKEGDRLGAATMLQTAAKTALKMGDQGGATILQTSATRLQAGEELSESDRKKTRLAGKTTLG